MMTYRDSDGNQYMAETYDDLADQMWRAAKDAPPTLEEWMEERAEHAKVWHDATLRIDSPESFVEDALIAGVLTLVE